MCDAVPSCQMRVSYFFSSSLFVNLNFFQRVSGDATQLLTDKNYVTIPMITTNETQKKTIPTGNKKNKKKHLRMETHRIVHTWGIKRAYQPREARRE